MTWTLVGGQVHLIWRETGGSYIAQPTREGFGSRLIASLAEQLKCEIAKSWNQDGLTVEVRFPV